MAQVHRLTTALQYNHNKSSRGALNIVFAYYWSQLSFVHVLATKCVYAHTTTATASGAHA
eukprot:14011-Heterococcus_DN1.PRE.3